ncbi:MAG: hypothetical protein K0R54_2588 [Clostridiaceae bacterium]|jgi:hypothetical protein|nr:hypothetical protein [Clostridiaceae bacterium]
MMEGLFMNGKKDMKFEERIYEDVINKQEIFATNEDDVVLNCDGEPCNFCYSKGVGSSNN